MANNYCESSSFIVVPMEKIEQAEKIIERIKKSFEESDEGYFGCIAEIEKNGVWIYGEENILPDHVENLVKTLVEELDLPGMHLCSWSYTCDSLRVGEFGGGAFVVQKGRDTVWIDAAGEAERKASLLPDVKNNIIVI